jgi:site-specific recombinase XerD
MDDARPQKSSILQFIDYTRPRGLETRGLSVLSNLLTFAWRKELIPVNPLLGYGKLPVDETVRRILEPTEERLIVQKTLEVDYTVGAYVGILGETGLRMEEGMNLKRHLFDTKRRRVTVEASKNYKPAWCRYRITRSSCFRVCLSSWKIRTYLFD